MYVHMHVYIIYHISLYQNSKLSHTWENPIRYLILEAMSLQSQSADENLEDSRESLVLNS